MLGFLLFSYAFHTLMFKRIELKCDARNTRSRAAILRLERPGTPRRNMVMHDGFIRYTDYFILVAA
jgi:RimJ/RimL family protein N-acetyltransferase